MNLWNSMDYLRKITGQGENTIKEYLNNEFSDYEIIENDDCC